MADAHAGDIVTLQGADLIAQSLEEGQVEIEIHEEGPVMVLTEKGADMINRWCPE